MKHTSRQAVLLALALATAGLTQATPSFAAGAQFCVAQSGTAGENSFVGNCDYSSYQQCLIATARSNGSCVANVDYQDGPRAELVPVRNRSNRWAR